ncbi:hypothetical protein BDA99DRAFT_537027 [Phascolomyces articulosus]|uniref:Uncharacterized protein n=1 Tax=Phascolomyces articulosus TaxID=60185 RepID=A0AAD5PEN3_9FUNG|nr:hypothetical protein BDA99DRAFT_537027 [Phascolomyces articulosus]
MTPVAPRISNDVIQHVNNIFENTLSQKKNEEDTQKYHMIDSYRANIYPLSYENIFIMDSNVAGTTLLYRCLAANLDITFKNSNIKLYDVTTFFYDMLIHPLSIHRMSGKELQQEPILNSTNIVKIYGLDSLNISQTVIVKFGEE